MTVAWYYNGIFELLADLDPTIVPITRWASNLEPLGPTNWCPSSEPSSPLPGANIVHVVQSNCWTVLPPGQKSGAICEMEPCMKQTYKKMK